MYANDVDVERRRSKTRVIIIIPANDDDGSCGIVDGRLLLLPFMFIEELSMFNYIGRCIEIDISKQNFFRSAPNTH